MPGSLGELLPDIDGHPEDYDIVHFDVEPRDLIVHHYKTIHGAGGNLSRYQVRRAASLRYCGDDIRFVTRPGAPPRLHHTKRLRDGDPLSGPDCYVGYKRLAAPNRLGGPLSLVGCWAHLRRRFYELHVAGSSRVATETVERMRALWAIEGVIRGRDPSARLAARRDQSVPVVQALWCLWEMELPRISGKSKFAEAIRSTTTPSNVRFVPKPSPVRTRCLLDRMAAVVHGRRSPPFTPPRASTTSTPKPG